MLRLGCRGAAGLLAGGSRRRRAPSSQVIEARRRWTTGAPSTQQRFVWASSTRVVSALPSASRPQHQQQQQQPASLALIPQLLLQLRRQRRPFSSSSSTPPPQHPSLALEEVERLKALAKGPGGMKNDLDGGSPGDWRASRELGMRYLRYGKRRVDMEQALEWLESAGKQLAQLQQQEEEKGEEEIEASAPAASEEEQRDLWYARALACLRVDQGMQEDDVAPPVTPSGAAMATDGVDGEPEWTEEIETETFGAKTGPEFVRVVRRRANRHKKARAKDEDAAAPRVHPKHKRALVRLQRAAQLGHVEATIQMGNILYENVDEDERHPPPAGGGGDRKTNLQRAVECYQRATEAGGAGEGQGHPDAWYNLGTIYFEGGPGVARNVPIALECFHMAASLPEETSGSAAFWLGHLYRVGDQEGGVKPDRDKALAFLQEACEKKEHPAACYYVAMLHRNGEVALGLPPDEKRFRVYLERAERLGDAEALFCLADMHLHGTDGVEKDEARALEYYRRAGEAGHPDALTSLGALFHRSGRYDKALEMYQRAGELGSIEAWRNLASMYMLGQGIPKNEAMAQHILKIVAKAEANKT